MSYSYPIGTPGQPWGEAEKQEWLAQQVWRRSYLDEVVQPLQQHIQRLHEHFCLHQYGTLPYADVMLEAIDYPLYIVLPQHMNNDLPTVLVTGGVHGYETSGVHGALQFLATRASDYLSSFNIVIAPCISPWGYETINRWNPAAVDPNRSFKQPAPAPEAAALMNFLQQRGIQPLVHIDLHETTDTDNSDFRPALAARDAIEQKAWHIPDGFYTVGNAELPEPEFQRAIIEAVAKVTHIAPPDPDGKLIGATIEQPGVIHYAGKKLGLCMGLSDARFVTTTEVYPDSEKTTPAECIAAQVAAVCGGLDYVRQRT